MILAKRLLNSFLIIGLWVTSGTLTFGDGMHRQTFQNTTGLDVNDLTLRWLFGISDAKINTRDNPPKTAKGAVTDHGINSTFAQNTFGTLGNNAKVDIDFTDLQPGFTASFFALGSFWTIDGNPVVNKFGTPIVPKVVGPPMDLAFNNTGNGAFAIFTNPNPFAVTYSNIKLFANNSLSNFTLDDFLTPTGSLVSGLAGIINLDACQTGNPCPSVILSFGTVDPLTYQLATADVAATSDPSNLFSVASAAIAVPEPATWPLLSVGLLLGFACNRAKLRTRSRINISRNTTLVNSP